MLLRKAPPLLALLGCLAAAAAAAEPLRAEFHDFGSSLGPQGWEPWSPRDEIRPACAVDTTTFRTAPDALSISGAGNAAEVGGWARVVGPVEPGKFYRLTAYYRAQGVPDVGRQVVARIDWLGADGKRAGQPDYAYLETPDGAWTRVTASVPAPEGAARARIELWLCWAPSGTVWWDDVSLEETEPPAPRPVRLGTISYHPHNNPDNLGGYLPLLDSIAAEKPDIVCLGEEIKLEGCPGTYAGAAEPIPGPSTERLGAKARQHGMYIVAGLTERDGKVDYNVAVLIDRHGRVAGKYRKAYLPREEVEGGLTPGNDCPVFDTDFGRVGMMICWDAEYGDPARAMALKGAEVILVPAAGGFLPLLRARAMENHLFLVSSGYDVETAVIDPVGEVLFSTMDSPVWKVVPVDLSRRYTDSWIGEFRPRLHKEVRRDLVPRP